MIAHLKGLVLRCEDESCVLDVCGVGYRICVGNRVASTLLLGAEVAFWIESLCHEGVISLFGFLQEEDQSWFRWLIGIQGVGGRVAQNLLSFFPPDQLSWEILQENSAALRRADGVGPKLANRLITELKDKAILWKSRPSSCSGASAREKSYTSLEKMRVEKMDMNNLSSFDVNGETLKKDVLLALTALGYKKNQALEAIHRAWQEESPSEMPLTGEDLLRKALLFV